jgi:DNA ligase (NAD+)
MKSFEQPDFEHEENITVLADGTVYDDLLRYNELKRLCVRACRSYYVLDAPLMQDFEYDVSFDNLRYYEAAHPEFDRSDSPTQYVGWNARMSKLL